MNQKLKREFIKVSVLLAIGIVLLIMFLNYTINTVGIKSIQDITGLENILIMLAILLYPVGVFYGWRAMLNIFLKIRGADRPPEGHAGSITGAVTIMNLAIAFTVTVCLGWVFGVYNAIRILIRCNQESW